MERIGSKMLCRSLTDSESFLVSSCAKACTAEMPGRMVAASSLPGAGRARTGRCRRAEGTTSGEALRYESP
jgi:hypothetical protein